MIHAIHSSIIIYYAKIPNSFLAGLAEHGGEYRNKAERPLPRIVLKKTKVYHLRDANERAEIFLLLAKLVWYLASGEAHVGYLYNHPENAIHKIVNSPHELF